MVISEIRALQVYRNVNRVSAKGAVDVPTAYCGPRSRDMRMEGPQLTPLQQRRPRSAPSIERTSASSSWSVSPSSSMPSRSPSFLGHGLRSSETAQEGWEPSCGWPEEGWLLERVCPADSRTEQAADCESHRIGKDGGIHSLCTSADLARQLWRKVRVERTSSVQ